MPIPVPDTGSTSPPAGALVSLDELKAHLNYRSTDTTDDTELQGFINAAADVIQAEVGPLFANTQTDVINVPWGRSLPTTVVLRQVPVTSITSIAVNNYGSPDVAVDPSAYVLDSDSGLLTRVDGFVWPCRMTITYTVGRSAIPPTVRLATLELIAHWWQNSQQGAGASVNTGLGFDSVDQQEPGYNAGVPYRILELLKPYRRGPAIA